MFEAIVASEQWLQPEQVMILSTQGHFKQLFILHWC